MVAKTDAKAERRQSAKEMGNRVKELREQKKITQTQLATYVGIGQQSVAEIEAGRTLDPKCIDKMASVLGISVSWLRYGKEDDISARSRYVAEKIDMLPDTDRKFIENLVEVISEVRDTTAELHDLREQSKLFKKHKPAPKTNM